MFWCIFLAIDGVAKLWGLGVLETTKKNKKKPEKMKKWKNEKMKKWVKNDINKIKENIT